MAKCEGCGKGPQFGNNVSHSMRHTKRRWNVNVQRTRLVADGVERRAVLVRQVHQDAAEACITPISLHPGMRPAIIAGCLLLSCLTTV